MPQKTARSTTASLLLLSLALAGCSNNVSQQASSGAGDSGQIVRGLQDQSVNQASSRLSYDDSSKATGIALSTSDDSGEEGQFNGEGRGNRALLGLKSHDGTRLSRLTGISFEAQQSSGALQLLISIDLNCDGAQIRTVSAEATSMKQSSAGQGSRRYVASFAASIWKASQPILDPKDTSMAIVGAGAETSSLTGLVARYPSACLRNGVSAETSLPKGRALASILFSLGSAEKTQEAQALITKIALEGNSDDEVEFDSAAD